MLTEANVQQLKKTSNTFVCEQCDYSTSKKSNFARHLGTPRHKMLINANEKEEEEDKKWKCEKCDKTYAHQSSLCRHSKTCQEHSVKMYALAARKSLAFLASRAAPEKEFRCGGCGRTYAHQSSLSRHITKTGHGTITIGKGELHALRKAAEANSNNQKTVNNINNNQKINNTNNTTNNIIYKPKITVNLFLNEHCKNALNLTDFVNKITVSLQDLEYGENHGLVKSITNKLNEALEDLGPTKRPIHCSDKKREKFYIKDNDAWEKQESKKIEKVITKVANKHLDTLHDERTKWDEENPDWSKNEKKNIRYMSMMNKLAGTVPETKKRTIINTIAKKTDIKAAMRELKPPPVDL